jgi:hypothetical protein
MRVVRAIAVASIVLTSSAAALAQSPSSIQVDEAKLDANDRLRAFAGPSSHAIDEGVAKARAFRRRLALLAKYHDASLPGKARDALAADVNLLAIRGALVERELTNGATAEPYRLLPLAEAIDDLRLSSLQPGERRLLLDSIRAVHDALFCDLPRSRLTVAAAEQDRDAVAKKLAEADRCLRAAAPLAPLGPYVPTLRESYDLALQRADRHVVRVGPTTGAGETVLYRFAGVGRPTTGMTAGLGGR